MSGIMTLDEFRYDMSSALGNKFSDVTRMVRWINFGYRDIQSSVDLDETTDVVELDTEILTQTMAVPSGTWHIELIRDATSDMPLGWLPRTEMFRRSLDEVSAPLNWHRLGSNIYLHPLPDDEYTLEIVRKKFLERMENEDDVSELSDIWDPAISMLANSHAFIGLGQERRAAEWLARAIGYIQTRITPDDFNSLAAAGLKSSVGLDRLNARLASLTERSQ